MTKEMLDDMTPDEMNEFMDKTCHEFDEDQSLDEYTEAVRDYIYIWRNRMEDRKGDCYTFNGVSKTVKKSAACIKQYYDEQAPVDDAAVDVDFECG